MKRRDFLCQTAFAMPEHTPVTSIRRSTRLSHLLSVCLGLAGVLAACNERATNVAPSPTSPTPQATPTLLPNPQPRATVSGTVFQTTPQGQRPISGARVLVVDLVDGPYVWGWDQVVTDIQGRFTSAYVFPGRAVKLTAYSGTGDGLWNQSGLSQMCAVHPTISEGNTTADIELVEAGVSPVTLGSPALSGVVYETSNGRRPVSGTPVLYSSNKHDGADVYAKTDANGRYSFCRLPHGPGYVLAGCAGASVYFPGAPYTLAHVDIRDDKTLDIDITSSFSGCP